MNTNKTVIAVIVILIILAGGAFLMMNQQKTDSSVVPSTNTQTEQNTSPVDNSSDSQNSASDGAMQAGVKEFTVTGNNFKFAPNQINVKKGDKVKITFTNASGSHDLVIDDFGVETKVLAAGASETVEFTADKTGTFEYYCSVGNHRQMGMVGKLIVE